MRGSLQQTTSTAKTFLSYTLKDPLGSRTLDAYRDARIFGFECFAKSFCSLQRGVEGNLSFFPRCGDQIRGAPRWASASRI
jgi:hypothetical protein